MKKLLLAVLGFVFLFYCVWGIYKIEVINYNNNQNNNEIVFPNKYMEKFNRINFETNIILPKNFKNDLFQYKAKCKNYDSTDVLSVLQNYNKKKITEDMLNISNGQIIFFTQSLKGNNLNTSFLEYMRNKSDIENINDLVDNDINNEIFKKLNIANITYTKSINLGEYNEINKNHCFLGFQELEGLKVFSSILDKNVNDYWSPFQVIYSSDGIEKLQILYAFDFKKQNSKIQLKSFDQIILAIKNEFDSIISDNHYEIDRAELMFWVDQKHDKTFYYIYPIWLFSIKEFVSIDNKEFIQYQKIVNAETGRIMELD